MEVHCWEGSTECTLNSKESPLSVFFTRVFREYSQNSVLFIMVLVLHSPLSLCLVFLSEPCRKSWIKDAWEGIDLLFHNYFVDLDPR